MEPRTYDRGAAVEQLRNSLRQLYGVDRAVAAFVRAERQHGISGNGTPPEVRELLRELEKLTDRVAPHRCGLDFLLRRLDEVAAPQHEEDLEQMIPTDPLIFTETEANKQNSKCGHLRLSAMGPSARMFRKGAIAVLAAGLLSSVQAHALDVSVRGSHTDPRRTLHLTGKIVPGDAARIRSAAKGLPPGTRLIGMTISSIGGDVTTSMELIDLVDELDVPLMVLGPCMTACGYLAAGVAAHQRLYLGREADVRVHRDYDENGVDDLADSIAVAKTLQGRGVPASIARKIVTTPSSELSSINAELLAMGALTD